MRQLSIVSGLLSLFVLAAPAAFAHGDVGNRTFPATLQFDDPSVGDELTLPQINRFKGSENGASAQWATSYSGEIERRLTDKFGVSLGGSFEDEDGSAGENGAAGWDNLELGAKYEFYDNDARELAMSFGIEADIGGSGSGNVGADYTVITPSLYFGKGAVELPGA